MRRGAGVLAVLGPGSVRASLLRTSPVAALEETPVRCPSLGRSRLGAATSLRVAAPTSAPCRSALAYRAAAISLASLCLLACGFVLTSAPALASEGFGVAGTFGSSSSTVVDPQPLSGPNGVAVNEETSEVYIVDQGNNRVEYFSSAGVFEHQFNGQEIDGAPAGAGHEAPAKLSGPTGIAIDNSTGPSKGDVYVIDAGSGVIDKFSATGEYISQLGGFAGDLLAIAVDVAGNLWVYNGDGSGEGQVNEFNQAGTREDQFATDHGTGAALAVDSLDNLYLSLGCGCLSKYDASGGQQDASETEGIAPISGLAVDLATNDLYVGLGTWIAQYGPFGEPLSAPVRHTRYDALSAGAGIAVNSSTHAVYAADPGANDVAIVGEGPTPPPPKTDAASEVRSSSASLNGDLNPEGVAGGLGFWFSWAQGSSCTGPGSATTSFDNGGSNVTGESDVDESTLIRGLRPETEYSFCFAAENGFGQTEGPVVKFSTVSTSAVFEPTVDSESASGLTPHDERLEARIATENQATKWHFEYASKVLGETLEGPVSVGSGTLSGNLEEQSAGVEVTGLKPDTTYYFRVVAVNPSGERKGKVEAFTTPAPQPPGVEVSEIYGRPVLAELTHTSATVSGIVDPNNLPVEACEFQYVTEAVFIPNDSFGLSPGAVRCTPSASELGSGDAIVGVGATIAGLEPNTSYYFRLVARNEGGLSGTPGFQFRTLPEPPTASTGEASQVGPSSATISGEVDPGSSGPNSDTTYFFQYSIGTGYEERLPILSGDVGEGQTALKESVQLTGLEPDTTYHYRIIASNDNKDEYNHNEYEPPQLVYGEGREFTTAAPPPALGAVSVSEVTPSSAVIDGSVNGAGLPVRYELRLGTQPGVLQHDETGYATLSGANPVAFTLTGLQGSTTYYFQLVAANGAGTVQSAEGSLTTLPAPPIQTLPLATFPQTQPLGSLVPANIFANEEVGIVTTTTKKAAKCAKGRKRSHGKCVKAKAKGKHKKRGKRS